MGLSIMCIVAQGDGNAPAVGMMGAWIGGSDSGEREAKLRTTWRNGALFKIYSLKICVRGWDDPTHFWNGGLILYECI